MSDADKIREWLSRSPPARLPDGVAEGADYMGRWAECQRFGTGPSGGSSLRRPKAGSRFREEADPASRFLR